LSKQKITYVCQSCGNISAKWLGRCPECNEWNSFVEEIVEKSSSSGGNRSDNLRNYRPTATPISLNSIHNSETNRHKIGINEFDQVLGGGIVNGSVILIGGEPGIGKSTIILQIAGILSNQGQKVLYVTGEESPTQIKMRSERLNIKTDNLDLLPTTSFEDLLYNIEGRDYKYIIVDSIQTINSKEITSIAGTVGQIRYTTYRLVEIAKQRNITIFIIGQITKDGNLAGPKMLEHLVDTVLYFEGDYDRGVRILRSVKNRFGSTDEVGIFEMTSSGLMESSTHSFFLDDSKSEISGRVLTTILEGSRPFLIEIQALVAPTFFQFPKRNATGFDINRLTMLIAILEKKLGINLSAADIYLNIAGGLKINEPAADLAVIVAIISSFKDIVIGDKTIFIGEVGLTGHIRQVSHIANRINEAMKFGVDKIVASISKDVGNSISVIDIKDIKDILQILENKYN